MDDLFILLHYLMSKLLLFLIAVAILLLFIKFFEKFYLGVKVINCFVFLFYHIFQVINLIPFEILLLIFDLLDFFLEDAVLFYLILQLLFQYFQSTIDTLGLIFCFIFGLDLFKHIIQLLIQLFELSLEGFVLFFLFLNQLQPQLMLIYISETRA